MLAKLKLYYKTKVPFLLSLLATGFYYYAAIPYDRHWYTIALVFSLGVLNYFIIVFIYSYLERRFHSPYFSTKWELCFSVGFCIISLGGLFWSYAYLWGWLLCLFSFWLLLQWYFQRIANFYVVCILLFFVLLVGATYLLLSFYLLK